MPFSSGERILLYLHLSRPSDGVFGGFDQQSISHECGIGRTHVPRSLKPLLDQGLVMEEKGRAPGRARRVKRYSLTMTGQQVALGLMEHLRSSRISLIGPDGIKNTMDPISVLSLVNAHLLRTSRPTVGLPLFLSLESDTVEWDDLLEVITKISAPEEMTLPGGWSILPPPYIPDPYIERPEGEGLIRLLSNADMISVIGKVGSGRRTLISKVLGEQRLRPLWIERTPGSPPLKANGGYDVLVIIDDTPPDPASMMMPSGNGDDIDPRDEGWDEDLRNMSLILVRSSGTEDLVSTPRIGPLKSLERTSQERVSNDMDNAIRHFSTIWIGPLPKGPFSEALGGYDIEEETIEKIYVATGGSPMVILALRSMDDDERHSILSGGGDDALFRLLVRMERSKVVTQDRLRGQRT
jgi:DNA-binding MarR family transcriptional regulator